MHRLREIHKEATPSIKALHWGNITLFCISAILASMMAACGTTLPPVSSENKAAPVTQVTPTETVTPTQSPEPSPSLTPTTMPSLTATLEKITAICSPLQGIELKDLHSITSQAFKAPSPFMDDGHPAVDLAFFTFEGLTSMLGHPVQAILPGKVVMVVDDRFPYGHMILIETPMEMLPDGILPPGVLPTPIPAENIALFDPCAQNPLFENSPPIQMDVQHRSVYSLYSHLKDKPPFEVGNMVTCGQTVGSVGITGNSVAEHLHLEIRIGPSATQFNTFGMYQPDVTTEERYNYCIWSTSGRFQAIDPARLWEDQS